MNHFRVVSVGPFSSSNENNTGLFFLMSRDYVWEFGTPRDKREQKVFLAHKVGDEIERNNNLAFLFCSLLFFFSFIIPLLSETDELGIHFRFPEVGRRTDPRFNSLILN